MRNILLACLLIGTTVSAAHAECVTGVGFPALTTDSYRLIHWLPQDIQDALKEKASLEFTIREMSVRALPVWQASNSSDLRVQLAAKDAALEAAISARATDDARYLRNKVFYISRKIVSTMRWGSTACVYSPASQVSDAAVPGQISNP